MKIYLNILIKRSSKKGKFDTDDLSVLERITFEIELVFGRLKERSKLKRNV
ncbi:MAG TPA: hypothetical protein VFY68_05455 [Nitrososphaeraceae archaeon]|nr:hypothetical protein [Nitrososphaeraceae archaeon]